MKCPTCQNDLLVPPAAGKGRLSVSVHTAAPANHGPAPTSPSFPGAGAKKKKGAGVPKMVVNMVVLAAVLGLLFFMGKKFNWMDQAKELYAKVKGEEAAVEVPTNAVPEETITNQVVEIPVFWTTNLAEVQFPTASPVKGMFGGTNISVEIAQLNNNVLVLREGSNTVTDRVFQIHLQLRPGESVAGKNYTIATTNKTGVPKIAKQWIHNPRYAPTVKWYQMGYTMKLSFDQPNAEGGIPGKIYLALPDAELSYVAGNFVASVNGVGAQAQTFMPQPSSGTPAQDAAMRARYGVR